MTQLAPNTVSKLNYFDIRIKSIYEKYGYISIPFDNIKVQKMMDEAETDLAMLFHNIWGSSMGYHLLNKFYSFSGNVYELFMSLDKHNRDLLTGKDW